MGGVSAYAPGASNRAGEIPMRVFPFAQPGHPAGELLYGYDFDPATLRTVGQNGQTDTLFVGLTEGAYLEPLYPLGLHVDETGVYDGDLFVVTGDLVPIGGGPPVGGNVWRVALDDVSGAGSPELIKQLGTYLEGVTTVPDEPGRFGARWAGKVLACAGEDRRIYDLHYDSQNQEWASADTDVGVGVEDIHVIPGNTFCYFLIYDLQGAPSYLCRIPAAFFASLEDDYFLVQTGEFVRTDGLENGELYLLHWQNGTVKTMGLTDQMERRQLEHALFTTLEIPLE